MLMQRAGGGTTLTPCPPPLSLVWLVCFLSFSFCSKTKWCSAPEHMCICMCMLYAKASLACLAAREVSRQPGKRKKSWAPMPLWCAHARERMERWPAPAVTRMEPRPAPAVLSEWTRPRARCSANSRPAPGRPARHVRRGARREALTRCRRKQSSAGAPFRLW